MSLINDVLKKLEYRHINPLGDSSQAYAKQARAPECYKESGCRLRFILLWLLVGAVLVAVGYYGYHCFTNHRLALRSEKVLANHALHKTLTTAEPTMVTLANPPLQKSVNTSLPPPFDLREKTRNSVDSSSGDAKIAPMSVPDTSSTRVSSTITLPASALSASPQVASEPAEAASFSLVETEDANVATDQQLNHILNLAKLGQVAQAEQLFNQLPPTIDAQNKVILQARLLILQNKMIEATALLVAFNQQNKPSVDTLGLLAALFQELGQPAKALVIYQQLVNFWPDNPTWWLGLAISAMDVKQYALAISAFEREMTFRSELSPEVSGYVQTHLSELMSNYPSSV